MRKSYLLLVLFVFGCTDTTSSETAVEAPKDPVLETERFHAWIDERHHEELGFRPWVKTLYGIKDEDYSRVGDVSETALDEHLAWRLSTTEAMQSAFSYEDLTNEGKTTYDLWLYQTERMVAAAEFRSNHYIFDQFSTSQQRLFPNLLINWHVVETRADAEAYVSRIAASAKTLLQYIDRAKRYADGGVHIPSFAYEVSIREAHAIIDGKPFAETDKDNPIWADFKSEVANLLERGEIDEGEAEALRTAASKMLIEQWRPAQEALIEWLEDDQPNASKETLGAGELPNGEHYYQERLKAHTTTDLTAQEIHEIGLSRVASLRAEIEAIAKSTGFEGPLSEFLKLLQDSKDDPRFYYSNDVSGRLGYLRDSAGFIDNIRAQLPNYFGLLPKADVVVKRVEPYREQAGAAQHYFPSSPDGSRPGVYYAHLIDMTSMPKYQLEAVAYHEALPGHHMQIAIATELEGVPEFRKRSRATAYSEGWGLYAERLANEMPGTYQDPYSQVGRISTEIWRAVRLVVDTGLHAMDWSEDQAVEYMINNSLATEGQARSEIRRYLVVPGQATAYMVGMLKILELRAQAEGQLGDQFDIREFHDVVLGGGALPLGLLERRINNWLASKETLTGT